jgi:hypothetical protein
MEFFLFLLVFLSPGVGVSGRKIKRERKRMRMIIN